MEIPKRIELIANDFNSLPISCGHTGTGQYGRNTDCPIARALKRMGFDVVTVNSERALLEDGSKINVIGEFREVENCRKLLLKGQRAFIETIQ